MHTLRRFFSAGGFSPLTRNLIGILAGWVVAPLLSVAQPTAGWADVDIGVTPGAGGSGYEAASGTYMVQGSGADISGASDSFHYTYQALSGDGVIIARVDSLTNTHVQAKAGLMMRETLGPGSKNVFLAATPAGQLSLQVRSADAGGTAGSTWSAAAGLPRWLKLERRGKVLSGYQSADGLAWTLVQRVAVDLATEVKIGLAVCSHLSTATLATAQFGRVSVTSLAGQGLPWPWQESTIGTPFDPGVALYDGSFVLANLGADIWSPADRLKFVSQRLTGDGTLTVKVGSVASADSWTRFGLMMRQSLQENAPNVLLSLTTGNGLVFQSRRTVDGATAFRSSAVAKTPPVWLKLQRTGNTFTASHSPDGQVWTVQGSETLPGLPPTIDVGLAYANRSATRWAFAAGDQLSLTSTIDTDGNGLSDAWERYYFNRTGVDPALDPDQDGLTHAQEWELGTDPLRATPAGQWPRLAALGGDQQTGVTGGLAPRPLRVEVRNLATGIPLEKAVVFFRVIEGDATVDGGVVATRVTDFDGLVEMPVRFGAAGGPVTVRASAGDNPQGGGLDFKLKALLGSPGSGLLLENTDIGVTAQPGRNRYEGGVYTLSARTNPVWGTADSADYAWKTLPGDGLFIARVAGLSAANPWAKAGLMLRESTAPNSRHVSIFLTPGNGVAFQGRDTTNGGSFNVNRPGVTAPRYLALRRSGGLVAAYYSVDGVAWTLLGTRGFVTGAACAGLVLSSESPVLSEASFDSVSLAPLAPAPWNVADIGAYNAGGIDQFATDAVTVAGGGADIWGGADNFRYVWQPLASDARLTARVASLANTHVAAKAGLMIRESTAPNSRYVLLMATPGRGVSLQARLQTGAGAVELKTLPGLVAPRWLKIERLGAQVTAYESADAVLWNPVGTLTWGPGPGLIGLAAASLNGSAPLNARFDHLELENFAAPRGWNATYYAGSQFGAPVLSRREAQIDLQAGASQAPAPGVPAGNYSVRWQGVVQPSATSTYTFATLASGGVRLWVNDQLLVDRWTLQASATEATGQVALTAGTPAKVVVEYFNGEAPARLQVRWAAAGQPPALLPTSQVQPIDRDDDGLPDAWESARGLNPDDPADATRSPDGDGFSYLFKYQLGLNPGQTYAQVPGALVVERWDNLAGGSVGNLTDNARFPLQPTTRQLLGATLEYGPNLGERYGLRIRGYLKAPVTGEYRFWVSGDDEAQLWLSPTESPFDREKIARTATYTPYQAFDQNPAQASRPIPLQAGRYYYLEILQKENAGGDHVSVAWQVPGQPRALIPAGNLASIAPRADNLSGDGLPDAWKRAHGLDPAKPHGLNGAYGDLDGDGLSNLEEYQLGTDPQKTDTDLDGATDQLETLAGTDPLDAASQPPGLAPWTATDIGTPATEVVQAGTTTGGYLLGSNAAGVPANQAGNDQLHLLQQTVAGDFEVSAYLEEEVENWWSRAALVVRSDLSAQSPAATLLVDHLGEASFLARATAGAPAAVLQKASLNPVAPAARGHWVKLRRQGRVITAAYSADGQSWVRLDSAAVGIDGPCVVGLTAWGTGIWEFSRVQLRLDSTGTGRFDDQGPVTYQEILTSADPVPPGTTLRPVATYPGSAGMTAAGAWRAQGDALISQLPESVLDFDIALPAAGLYRLEIEAQSPGNPTLNVVFPVEVVLDGQTLGRAELIMNQGEAALAHVATPFLSAGTHRVRLFYDSTLSYRPIQINALRVQALDGPDTDANGRSDWIDDRLALINTLRPVVAESYVSPVNIEGTARFPAGLAVTAETVPLAVLTAPGHGWYADVPLSPVGEVAVTVAFENGALNRTAALAWKPLNLLAASLGAEFPAGMLRIRQGDSLRLTAWTANASGSATVAIIRPGTDAVQYTLASPQAEPVLHAFDTAGTYLLTGVSGGATGTLTVEVVAARFNGEPTAGLGRVLDWDNPLLPASVALEVDQGLSLTPVAPLPGGGQQLHVLTQNIADSLALARLSPAGPILARTTVRSLRVASNEQTAHDVLATYPDGSRLIGTPIILNRVTPSTRVVVDIVVSGVTFEDGTLTREFAAADFDSLGRLYVKFLFPKGLNHSFCHRITVYDGTTLLGTY